MSCKLVIQFQVLHFQRPILLLTSAVLLTSLLCGRRQANDAHYYTFRLQDANRQVGLLPRAMVMQTYALWPVPF